jgi:phage FluMu protein gp41
VVEQRRRQHAERDEEAHRCSPTCRALVVEHLLVLQCQARTAVLLRDGDACKPAVEQCGLELAFGRRPVAFLGKVTDGPLSGSNPEVVE